MLKKNRPQLDMFDHIIFEKLVPKDHLLIKIDSIIDFSFIYDLVKDQYSSIGRGSKDPVMLVKIFLLEYLYRLSDVEVVKRIQTDIVFRWFLNLGINDTVPDDIKIGVKIPIIIGSLNQTPILNTYYNFEDHWLKLSMVFNTFLEEINMKQMNETIITLRMSLLFKD